MSDIDGLKCLCEEYACPCHFEMKKLKPERDKLLAEVEKLKKAIFQTGEKFCEIRAERDDLKLQIDEIRKAWELVETWVGVDSRSDSGAERDILAVKLAMRKALHITNVTGNLPQMDVEGRVKTVCEKCGQEGREPNDPGKTD